MMTTEIDPCAFCGEYDGECAISGVPNLQGKRKFAVYCNGCFSEGPPAETKEEAIEAWNTRSPTPAASGATPGEFEPWLRTICITAPPPQAYDLAKQAWAQGMKRGAALASREASPAPLTDTQRKDLLMAALYFASDEGDFVVKSSDELRIVRTLFEVGNLDELIGDECKPAALASPQVAPAKVYLVATGEVVDGMETYTRHEGAPPPLCDSELLFATPVQVAPQDDARDAAEDVRDLNRRLAILATFAHEISAGAIRPKDQAGTARHLLRLTSLPLIDDVIALHNIASTPAAKPTEGQP